MKEKFTKIVCTIGPSSDDEKTLKNLFKAGMNVARLNFSHAKHEYCETVIKRLRKVCPNVAVLLDTKGPEIRTGEIKNNLVTLKEKKKIILTNKKIIGTEKKISVDYKKLNEVEIGSKFFIDDGLIELEIIGKEGKELEAKILNGGELSSKKTVTIHGHSVKIPFLSKKDIEDIEFGIKQEVDFIAASFVRKPDEVKKIKNILNKNNSKIKIISKIEHLESVENFDKILKISDGVMVARGDLGVEIPIEKVPQCQRDIIRKSRKKGKPVIVATQMLESMKSNPRPTRAEVNDVALAIVQGTDAIMLSGETANGKYPVKAVEMMSKIAKEYELKTSNNIDEKIKEKILFNKSISLFIAKTAYLASKNLELKAILTPTESGFTARNISRFRPNCPIYALIRDKQLQKQLQLSRGVIPVLCENKLYKNHDKMINEISLKLYKEKKLTKNCKFVVTAGLKIAESGHTNMVEIYKMKRIFERMKK